MLSMWIDFSRIAPTWRSRETLDRVASSIPSHSSSLTIAKGCSRAKPDRRRLRGLFILSPWEGGWTWVSYLEPGCGSLLGIHGGDAWDRSVATHGDVVVRAWLLRAAASAVVAEVVARSLPRARGDTRRFLLEKGEKI
jgi:hypothetical protein